MTTTSNEHPSQTTNDALNTLAKGKACSVPLWVEQGFVTLHPSREPQRYTKAQAKKLLKQCYTQAKGATRYADDLPADPAKALELKHNDAPLWAKALNASTSRYTEAGKTIRTARDLARIAETGGWVHTPSGIVGPSKRKPAQMALRADPGPDWWKADNVDDLRKSYRADCVQVSEAPAPAPVVEAQTAPVTKAVLVDRCKQLSLSHTGTKADLQARINAVPLAETLGWHA